MKWIIALAFALPLVAANKCLPPCGPCDRDVPQDPLEHIQDGPDYPCEKPPKGCIPFDADLFKRCKEVYSVHAEFLYWKVVEGGLDYALKMNHAAWGPDDSFAQGTYESGTFNLEPGFRIGAVYFRALHNWEMRVEYTRLTARGSNSAQAPNVTSEFLTATWPVRPTTVPLTEASSHTHMNYNVFDYTVDRVFTPNFHVRLRYLGGLLVAWMDQDWKVRYTDQNHNITVVQNRWSYTGAGLKTGTVGDWFLTHDIYLTAQATFGALIGQYHNKALQRQTFAPSASDNTSIPVRNALYSDTRPAFQVQFIFGPSWQKNFTNTRVEAFLGYETNFWFNLQNIYHSTAAAPSAPKETWINNALMGMYGLTARVTVDF